VKRKKQRVKAKRKSQIVKFQAFRKQTIK